MVPILEEIWAGCILVVMVLMLFTEPWEEDEDYKSPTLIGAALFFSPLVLCFLLLAFGWGIPEIILTEYQWREEIIMEEIQQDKLAQQKREEAIAQYEYEQMMSETLPF